MSTYVSVAREDVKVTLSSDGKYFIRIVVKNGFLYEMFYRRDATCFGAFFDEHEEDLVGKIKSLPCIITIKEGLSGAGPLKQDLENQRVFSDIYTDHHKNVSGVMQFCPARESLFFDKSLDEGEHIEVQISAPSKVHNEILSTIYRFLQNEHLGITIGIDFRTFVSLKETKEQSETIKKIIRASITASPESFLEGKIVAIRGIGIDIYSKNK